MQAFVPKTRRPKFELQLKILDLNNVPLVSGTSLVKWHLPHSTSAEHRGRTKKCHIKEHKVMYDYEKLLNVKLTVDKTGLLQESIIQLEVLQEYSSSAKGERIILGTVKLNLAEYVDAGDVDGEDGVCRRYLMQESKINSTLKIGIRMTLLDGDHNFEAPPLKTAPVFGGIAGIIASETVETDDSGHLPTLSSKSRETGETQDMYRRNLAAFWAAQPGELRADDCIEDIFAGGDGWGSHVGGNGNGIAANGNQRGSSADEEQHGNGNGIGRAGSGGRKTSNSDRLSVPGTQDDNGGNGASSGANTHHSQRPSLSGYNSRSWHRLRRSSPGSHKESSSHSHHRPRYGHNENDSHGGRHNGNEFPRTASFGFGGDILQDHTEHDRDTRRGSIEHNARELKAKRAHAHTDDDGPGWRRAGNEVDELMVREDLRSWRITDEAMERA